MPQGQCLHVHLGTPRVRSWCEPFGDESLALLADSCPLATADNDKSCEPMMNKTRPMDYWSCGVANLTLEGDTLRVSGRLGVITGGQQRSQLCHVVETRSVGLVCA